MKLICGMKEHFPLRAHFFRASSCLFVLALGAALADNGQVQLKPLHVGASMNFGQMFNISDSLQEEHNFNPTVTIPTTSLWMIQEASAGERLTFSLGIAGTFWYPFPEDTAQGWTSYRTGGVAIAQAMGVYAVGDLRHPWMHVSVGQQGYKYNPYAKNFGEYLFRSEAYPTTVRTGDWGAIDNAGAGIWGMAFKTDFLGGMIQNDLLVTMANEHAPLHDISFTDIASVNIGKVFQIGGGVTLSRYIQIDPKKSKRQSLGTGWITWSAADQQRLSAYIHDKLAQDPNFLNNNIDFQRTVVAGKNSLGVDSLQTSVDTSLQAGDYWADSKRPLVYFLVNSAQKDSVAVANGVPMSGRIEYVDTKTIFLMGRASFDPKPLLGWGEFLSPSDLVLYGEVSVLGLDNYPVYYRKISERTPIMAGFYLPTFKFLDYLTVEMEYFKNPHINSDYLVAIFRAPRPRSPDGTAPEIPSIADPFYDGYSSPSQYNVNHTADDFKWTVTAQRSFGVWNLAFQTGKDHYRPLTGSFRPTYTEAANTKDAWYYMLRLMVNL